MTIPKPTKILSAAVRHLPEVHGGVFRVADDGRVYRRKGDDYVLAPQSKTARGGKYLAVTASIEGKQKAFLVHRLVAEAYIPNPDNKREVNHLDGNGFNNHVGNLQWSTRKENTVHAYENGLLPSLSSAGIPCILCGKLTMSKDRVCGACKVDAKIIERRLVVAERKAKTIEIILNEIDEEKVSSRDIEMLRMYGHGATLQEIGDRYSLSHERVRQIINRCARYRLKEVAISDQQKGLSSYISYMGFRISLLASRLGVTYYMLSQMLSLKKHMPDSVYEKLSGFVKFEYGADAPATNERIAQN